MANAPEDEDLYADDNLVEQTNNDEIKQKNQNRKARQAQKNSIPKQLAKKGLSKTKPIKKIKEVLGKIKNKLLEFLKGIIGPVVAIFMIIGIVVFIINMPGFISQGIYNKIQDILQKTDEWLIGEDSVQLSSKYIDDEKRLEILNYISKDLGIDIVGFGFVPSAVINNEGEVIGYVSNLDEYVEVKTEGEQNWEIAKQIFSFIKNPIVWFFNSKMDKLEEVVKDDPDSDLIFYYIMANERAYLLKSNKLGRFFGSEWYGMLDVDTKSTGEYVNSLDYKEDEVTVDRENKILEIKSNNAKWNAWKNTDNWAFSLDGWTGRYGMPLEFSLALHLSTMSSGMVKEILTNPNLQTEVNIALNKIKCKLNYEFNVKTKDGNYIKLDYHDKDNNKELIAEKIKNSTLENVETEISDEDLSIEGIIYAANEFKNKYVFPLYGIDGSQSTGRHIETIEAMIGKNDMAVDLPMTYYNDSLTLGAPSQTGYQEGFSITNYANYPIYALGPGDIYTLYSGAYICSYDDKGRLDQSTGKLGYTVQTYNGGSAMNYKETFELESETANEKIYEYKYYEMDPDTKEVTNNKAGIQIQVRVPTGGASDVNGDGYIRISSINSPYFNFDMANNRNSKVYEAYIAIFQEIDWFLAYSKSSYPELEYAHYNGNIENLYDISNIGNEINPSAISYYTDLFNKFLDGETLEDGTVVDKDLIVGYLKDDLALIKGLEACVTTNTENNEKLNKLLSSKGIDIEQIQKMANVFEFSVDVDNDEVEYTQPYIESVTKHWFKDVDFSDAYTKTDNRIEIPLETAAIQGVEIKAILTPKGDDTEKNGLLTQGNNQPYVIKGDYVLLEGEYQGTTQEKYENKKPESSYKWGDGYRAAKKILTQGKYYTYDGSHETSLSIYWQQKIEDMEKGKVYSFTVKNKRISAAINHAQVNTNLSGMTELTVDSLNGMTPIYKDDENGIILYKTGDNSEAVENDSTITPKTHYAIKITKKDAMKYLSPAENDIDKVNKRVEAINKVWEAAGVEPKRVPVSFDNETQNGETMTQTALSILKNCDTKDAEHIYRDLKEMLIDLGYYTQAEFDVLDTAVLKWFIPEYNPEQWPQNTGEEGIMGAVLYPMEQDEEGSNTSNSSENVFDALEISADRSKGFEQGLEVVAPGDCKIIEIKGNTIEIEFDGASEPRISRLDGYHMIISGINVNNELAIGASVKEGDRIGTTGTKMITIFMTNDIGRNISNVEDYMKPFSADGDFIMLDVEEEEIVAMIWEFEGVSDADGNPNDDYYIVVHSATDVPTVGHGITAATAATWYELGYGEYIKDGIFMQQRIPKNVVDNVSKMEIHKTLEYLDSLLEKNGVVWGGNQKAAWVSLYYNGWHNTVISLIQDYANKNYTSLRQKWLYECVNIGTIYEKGHKNRRAQEWILFKTGELLSKPEAYNLCYVQNKY